MGRYEMLVDEKLERAFKRVVKEKTHRPPARIVRAFFWAFIENPDFYLDNLSGFLDNKKNK